MKKLPTFIITVAIVTNSFAQAAISADSLDKKLSAYFDEYTPELFRYSGLTFYGEARINFSQDQISKEIQLLNEVKKSDLLNKPTPNVFALCHNIIIHSPSDGKEFLKLLDKPTTDEYIIGLLYSEMI